MKTTIFFVELIFSIAQDVNINNTKVYLHVHIELLILQKKTEYRNIFIQNRIKPGSSKDKIWNDISNGSCAKGSEQSDGQSRCQLSAVRSDKRCHWGVEQEL
jgi:hypothetical protein